MRSQRRRRGTATLDERGAGTILTAAATVVVSIAGCLLILAGGLLIQLQQTQNAADLAALAGAAAQSQGQDACAAVRAAAQRNSVQVVSCQLLQAPGSFVVAVQVERRLQPNLLLSEVRSVREAAAGTS